MFRPLRHSGPPIVRGGGGTVASAQPRGQNAAHHCCVTPNYVACCTRARTLATAERAQSALVCTRSPPS
eukprot:scaffold7709_cov101-Isochrysis_galbana.AAC.4